MKLEELIPHSQEEVAEIIHAPDPYSVFENYQDFKILLLRRIQFNSNRIDFVAESFVLRESSVYYLDRQLNDFLQLKNSYYDLVNKLELYYKNNQKIISAYSGQIEQLENYLFDRNMPSHFMDIWFDLKKDLSKLENYYYRNGIVYHEFLKKSEASFGKYLDEYKDVGEGIQFQASNIETLKSRLDGIHHYYDSIKSDRLNKTILTLTVISGIFLPLNLIVGFFGMNTPGLFFSNDTTGTQKVILILGSVLLICVLGIPLIHLMDRYILRTLLGRYDFYKNISSRIDELSDRFSGKL